MVRSGRLFRSGGLQWATDTDTTGLRELGLQTVIDLRTSAEVELLGRPPKLDGYVRIVHIPVSEEPDLIEREGASFARVLTALAQADAYPAAVHCGASVYRTGIAVALVLSLIGSATGRSHITTRRAGNHTCRAPPR